MKRIGLAASKVSKGNVALYNIFVVVLSVLFSTMVFFMSAFSIIIALVLTAYVSSGFTSLALTDKWFEVFKICMAALAFVVGIINIAAILLNIQFKIK